MAKTEYTRNDIIKECTDKMNNDIGQFYNLDFIKNPNDKTTDTDELITEVVAEFVLKHIKKFQNNIPTITRGTTYKTPSHENFKQVPNPCVTEPQIAKAMYVKHKEVPFNCIGKIIDFQTPLKNPKPKDNKDNNEEKIKAGKIDLLSDTGKQLIILELKRPNNGESMLRCVLEVYTYLQTVDQAKLLEHFGKPKGYEISASPLVFDGGAQHLEMQKDRPNLRELMEKDKLNITPYYYSLDITNITP